MSTSRTTPVRTACASPEAAVERRKQTRPRPARPATTARDVVAFLESNGGLSRIQMRDRYSLSPDMLASISRDELPVIAVNQRVHRYMVDDVEVFLRSRRRT